MTNFRFNSNIRLRKPLKRALHLRQKNEAPDGQMGKMGNFPELIQKREGKNDIRIII
jgi:hypothetical protein